MLKSALALTLLSTGSLVAEASKEQCPPGPHHMRADVRHIEAGGIGYNKGYTTLEAFFASDPNRWAAMPFLDLRGHVFNDGKFAANAGMGLRGMWGCGAYGINGYYDYRNTHRRHYNQVGVGLERLGRLVDVRINGYLPVGKKISHAYGAKFGGFEGNSVLVKRKYQFAMKGADAEIGFHFGKTSDFDFYGAIGPYYFKGEIGRRAWGGKARVAGYFREWLTLELSDSWDNVFKNNVQGQLSLTYPFGARSIVKPTNGCDSNSCDFGSAMAARMVQPVARQEIVVVDSHHKKKAADNFFIFVNNLSHSAGTFESPYGTLAAAETNSKPGDYIYVFAGDGTPTGMNTGITLQDNQQLLGSSGSQVVATNLGTITIPPQTSLIPTLSNSKNEVIILANNNVVSGFNIDFNPNVVGSGIVNTTPITSAKIVNNNIISYNGDGCVNLTNVSGDLYISNNNMTTGDFTVPAISIINTNIHDANYFIENNTISIAQFTVELTYSNCSAITTNITNNLIYNDSNAIAVTLDNTSSMPQNIFNISSNNMYIQDLPVVAFALTDFATASVVFSGNDVATNDDGGDGIDLILHNNSFCNLSVDSNSIRATNSGISVVTHDNSGVNLDVSNNFIRGQGLFNVGDGIQLIASDNSVVNLRAFNNFLGGGDDTALNVTTHGNAIANASLFRNTLQSVDGDVIDFTSNSTAPNGLNLFGNTFLAPTENPPTLFAINCIAASTGPVAATIVDNNISFSDVAISNTSTGNMRAIVDRNQLLAATVNTTNSSTGTICQRLNNNVSSIVLYTDGTTPYNILNTDGGKLFLETPTGNVGQFTITNVTPVAPGTCVD